MMVRQEKLEKHKSLLPAGLVGWSGLFLVAVGRTFRSYMLAMSNLR